MKTAHNITVPGAAKMTPNMVHYDTGKQEHIASISFNYAFGVQEHYSASAKHFALATFLALINATREKLGGDKKDTMTRTIFTALQKMECSDTAESLKIRFVPGCVDMMADEILGYVYSAQFTELQGFIILTALFNDAFAKITITKDDQSVLTKALFEALSGQIH